MTLVKCILVAGAALCAAFGTTGRQTDAGPAPASVAPAQPAGSMRPVIDMSRLEQVFRR